MSVFHKLISPSLDPSKNWFALSTDICDGPPSKFTASVFARAFSEECREIALSELRTEDGESPSAKWFICGKKGNVFVGTTFGITGGMLRNRDLTQH